VIVLAGARSNATAIARHLAQGPDVEFENHAVQHYHHPDPKLSVYKPVDARADAYHTGQLDALVARLRERTRPIVLHLVTGWFSVPDLRLLRSTDALVCAVVRSPGKQMASLKTLPTNPLAGPEEQVKRGFVEYTWENLDAFRAADVLDFAFESERYLADAQYRQAIFSRCGLPLHPSTSMPRHRGDDFFEHCAITRHAPHDNPWNGLAGTSDELQPDLRGYSLQELTEWQRSYLPRAIEVHDHLLRDLCHC
jgi:hypothetical protein